MPDSGRRRKLKVSELPGASHAPKGGPSQTFKDMVDRVEHDTRPTEVVVGELRKTASYTPPPLVRLRFVGLGILLGLVVAAAIVWGPRLYLDLVEPVLFGS